MTLYVLKIGPEDSYGLYNADDQTCMLKGKEEEMYEWKHKMETEEQNAANSEYMKNLLKERVGMLVSAGNSHEQAEVFLKKTMPYLYANTTN